MTNTKKLETVAKEALQHKQAKQEKAAEKGSAELVKKMEEKLQEKMDNNAKIPAKGGNQQTEFITKEEGDFNHEIDDEQNIDPGKFSLYN